MIMRDVIVWKWGGDCKKEIRHEGTEGKCGMRNTGDEKARATLPFVPSMKPSLSSVKFSSRFFQALDYRKWSTGSSFYSMLTRGGFAAVVVRGPAQLFKGNAHSPWRAPGSQGTNRAVAVLGQLDIATHHPPVFTRLVRSLMSPCFSHAFLPPPI
jgi:hypothetical protein